MRLSALAAAVGGTPVGEDVEIVRITEIEAASSGAIVMARDAERLRAAAASAASALLLPASLGGALSPERRRGKPAIVAENLPLAFARALALLHPEAPPPAGVDRTAVLGADVQLGPQAAVGAYAVLGDGCRLGSRVRIGPGCVLGAGVVVGDDSLLHARVTVYDRTVIGRRCIVHSGAVIGADGFGYAADAGRHVKIPHRGRVVIEDDVEIGANTTIDRATLGETRIGEGTKIDNLVQIGHNVTIGRHAIIVAQVGISGSVTIGDGAILAGQAGVVDHVRIGAGARVLARAMVTRDVPAGETWSGAPARPHREDLRAQAALRRIATRPGRPAGG